MSKEKMLKKNVEKVTENVEFIWPFLITPAGVR
jgi:hypothetical protein